MKNNRKRFKMVSINYTWDCAKKPRCSFCYLKKAELISRLKGEIMILFMSLDLHRDIVRNTEQVAIAYNGLHIAQLIRLLSYLTEIKPPVLINITTNPEFVTPQIASLFRIFKVKMVALSLDPEKCGPSRWKKAAFLLKKRKIKIGLNALMLDEMFSRIFTPKYQELLKIADQIHLLRPKFYKTKIPLQERKNAIFLLKAKFKNLFIDQCFKNELEGIPCTRGKDFVSINPDNTVTPCSFDIYGRGRTFVKKCPYI